MSEQQKKFDLLVMIGRFRPFHLGHKHVVDEALKRAHNVLILVGSANRPRTFKNPWTFDEVYQMIHSVYASDKTDDGRLSVQPLDDWMHDNDFRWLMNVQRAVATEESAINRWHGTETKLRIGLVGFSKDHTSYYLKKFPQWESFDVGAFKHKGKIVNATDIRRSLLIDKNVKLTLEDTPLPDKVRYWMHSWNRGVGYQVTQDIQESVEFATKYKADHKYVGGQPYNAIHTTTDSVFIQSGHVLLIRRKFNPGKGLWALPGGFAHEFEALSETSKREAKEETKIKLSREVIDLSFRFKHVFSDPNRSDDRGRIITHAYLYLLNDRQQLVEVEAADDAAEAKWVPLGLLNPNEIYSDHFWIIHKLLDMLPVD